MGTLISVLIIIVCLFLILVVLIQNSKGGGLASSFGSSNQVMGVKKTADVIEKITWGLAIALVVLSIVSTSFNKPSQSGAESTESVTKQKATEAPVEMPASNNGIPNAPVQPNPGGPK